MKLVGFKTYFDFHSEDHIDILWRELCEMSGLTSQDVFSVPRDEEDIPPKEGWFMDDLSPDGSFSLFKNGEIVAEMVFSSSGYGMSFIEGTIGDTRYRGESNKWVKIPQRTFTC